MQKLLIVQLFWSVILLRVYAQEVSDSLSYYKSIETSIVSEMQEDRFQGNLNSLFMPSLFDTFAWNTNRINSGHFDPDNWVDTEKIILVDSSNNKFYCHPFKNYITSDFGSRNWSWHYGVDIKL